jgi:hypothetical protein
MVELSDDAEAPTTAAKSALRLKLAELAQDDGLRRPNLVYMLGGGLSELCEVRATDEPGSVFDRVANKFATVIQALPRTRDYTAEEVQLSVKFWYNIADDYPSISELKLIHRQHWLGAHPGSLERKGEEGPRPILYSTQRKHMPVVYDLLEKAFLLEWKVRFPDKPFPVDDKPDVIPQVPRPVPPVKKPPERPTAESPPSVSIRHWRATLIASLCALLLIPVAASSGPTNEQPVVSGGTENPLGNALSIQLQSVSSVDPSAGIAFSVDDANSESYYTDEATVGLLGNDYNEALQGGAYLVSGARVEVKVSTKGGQQADIYKIRPIKADSGEPVATGLAIRPFGNAAPQGQFAESLGFNLDEQTPLAHTYENGSIEGLALDGFGIPVEKTLPEELDMNFVGYEHSYSFTIEIEYTVNGVRYSQIVSLGGKPFRMSPDICVTEAIKYKLTETEVQALTSLRYQEVLVPDNRAGATPHSYTDERGGGFSDSCQ